MAGMHSAPERAAPEPLVVRPANDSCASIPINTGTPFPFETDAFKGQIWLWVAGLPSSPPGLFSGLKRRTHLVVQVLILVPGRHVSPFHLIDPAR